jgi:predicted amidohydrolase
MRVAIAQTNPKFGEVKSNVSDAITLMESVNADLFVLPELFNTGYNFLDAQEAESLAETVTGLTLQAISEFAGEKSSYVVYGFVEKADRLYNSAALVGPGGLIGIYRKVHLYYREKLFFAPGNLGFPVFDLPFGKIGMMICFDWIYPESARTLTLNGAQIIVHPSNLVLPHCPDSIIVRCLENRIFSVTANRVGRENRGSVDLKFIGKSEVVSPQGEILTRLGDNESGIAVADIDFSLAKNKRLNEFNDLFSDRRPDQYHT